jgi:hypothetical protein
MRRLINPRSLKICVTGMALCATAHVFAYDCGKRAEPPFDDSLLAHARAHEIWSLYVQAEPVKKGECPLYRLKKAPAIPYARIEPTMLDAYRDTDYLVDEDGEYIRDETGDPVMKLPEEQRLGFVARLKSTAPFGIDILDRNGYNVLLNSRGDRIIPNEFNLLVFEEPAEDGTLIARITLTNGHAERYTYLHFRDGRLLRRAPRRYDGQADTGPSWGKRHRMVMLRKGNEWFFAPLNLLRLSEVLPFSHKSMGYFELYEQDFFYTQEFTDVPLPPGIKIESGGNPRMLPRYQVHDSTGALLPLPEFHEYRKQFSPEAGFLLALYNYESMTCRLYAAHPEGGLSPVIEQPLPLDPAVRIFFWDSGWHTHDCPNFVDGGRLFARHADKTRIFIVKNTQPPDARPVPGVWPVAREEGEAPGAFFAVSGNRLVVKMKQQDESIYRIFDLEHRRLSEEWFEDAYDCGDGHIFLMRAGVWHLPDGSRPTDYPRCQIHEP